MTKQEEIREGMADIECDRCGAIFHGYKALTRQRLCRACRESWDECDG
ncbi:unnamed protein product, partial [marine sediment metagenome]